MRLSFAAIAAVMIASAPAGAQQIGPTIVVDASSGQVLQADRAGQPWFPASLTKMMTAYVALREVRAGALTLDTQLRVSPRAARASPSKMGFRPGMTVTLDNALKIIMVKSA
ncbi:MAG: serine hydrolase, partial [Alphaproteobacteria bacterium]